MAFKSKKLSETERRWPTHEKEMWAVIHCLKTWGHYIGSKDVVMWTNNVTLKYFATQPTLSSKQVRWQDTLALFNVDIRHKPGKDNVVPDALSRKHQLKVVYVGGDGTSKGSSTSKPLRCICQGGKAKHSKWSQVPLPFAKWIIVVQTKTTLCTGRKDEGHHLEGVS
jgi:hypothetical protein